MENQRLSYRMKKEDWLYATYKKKKKHFNYRDTNRLKIKGLKKIWHTNTNEKKAVVAIQLTLEQHGVRDADTPPRHGEKSLGLVSLRVSTSPPPSSSDCLTRSMPAAVWVVDTALIFDNKEFT